MHPNPFRIAALLGLLFLPSVLSHHLVAEIHIDSIPQGPGTCMRVPPNTNPMTNIYSADMACNVGGGNSVALTCHAKGPSPAHPTPPAF